MSLSVILHRSLVHMPPLRYNSSNCKLIHLPVGKEARAQHPAISSISASSSLIISSPWYPAIAFSKA